ncbi:MAG: tRNA (adenosine(37)-N6)-threonylcarbamoyltransferase complex dimerization subunit type 1 TsaB [Treponema sp.]|nr:tRNA (adenosine(37)-N6)-threonylcarbamoyltransferase complex dimerization subunit type 1 TsaB [Treponema sp.]
MKLLALDTFSPVLSAALLNDETIHYAQINTAMKHSELVMELTDSLFKEAKLKPSDLEGVLCMEGPGSFTGLRIGYSIAKGLALSLSIPFAAIPTFDCVAYGFKDSDIILTLTDARKNAWFYAFFREEKRLCHDGDGDYSQIINFLSGLKEKENKKIILTGPGSSSFFAAVSDERKNDFIIKNEKDGYAGELVLIARERNIFRNDNSEFLFSGPRYLRKSDAELNS